MLLEVIVQTVEDARAATEGGADRLEVVRDIRRGGLTPPLSLVRAIASETPLPLRIMVRANDGYGTTADEVPILRRAVEGFAALSVDGLVVGFATGGEPEVDQVRRVLEAAPGVHATFHRAFDSLRDPLRALDLLAAIEQVDRVLTSGGSGSAAERCDELRSYVMRAGTRLTILAGGGVTEESLALFARRACVREVHVGRIAREHGNPEGPVSPTCVRRLRRLADAQDGILDG
jgi:copper homeostasis protein